MRGCVIGNSHAAALKSGLEPGSTATAFGQVTFFASRGQTLGRLALVDGLLTPPGGRLADNLAFTSGGLDHIDPAAYDVFVLCGLGFGLRYELLGSTDYSERFVHDYCHEAWKRSVCLEVHGLIRRVSQARIFICPEPYLSETARKKRDAAAASETRPIHLLLALHASASLFAGPSTLLPQGTETVVDEIFTAARFTQGSQRLSVRAEEGAQAHGMRDVAHMNGDYGARCWEAIAKGVAQAASGAASGAA